MIPFPGFIGINRAFPPPGDAPSAPVNITPPVASGAGYNGQTLTVTDGTWTNSPTGFTYQWQSNAVNLPGETSNTYQVSSTTEGTELRCVVTASNAFGSNDATSNTIHNWIPTDSVGGSQSWWDFSDSSQITLSGSDITQITDKGSLAETMATSNTSPELVSAVQNGLDAARYDGALDGLIGSSLSKYNFIHDGGEAYVCAVVQANEGIGGGVAAQIIAANSRRTAEKGFFLEASDTDRLASEVYSGTGAITASTFSTNYSAMGSWSIVGARFDVDNPVIGDRLQVRANGTTLASNSTINAPGSGDTNDPLALGTNPRIPGLQYDYNGDMGEVVILNTLNDIEKCEGYFAWKWGLVSDLPVSHPYKNNPPPP